MKLPLDLAERKALIHAQHLFAIGDSKAAKKILDEFEKQYDTELEDK